MTAAATVDGIREVDSTDDIGLISAELDAPSRIVMVAGNDLSIEGAMNPNWGHHEWCVM